MPTPVAHTSPGIITPRNSSLRAEDETHMSNTSVIWNTDLAEALAAAERERKFVLVDFSKER